MRRIVVWVSDGTPDGTRLLHDPGTGADIADLVVAGGIAFFTSSAYDAASGLPSFQLWASDGTSEGTRLLREHDTPVSHRDLDDVSECLDHGCALTAVGDRLFFIAEDSPSGAELWTSDGTAVGTSLVRDIAPGPTSTFAEAGYTAVGAEMWVGPDDRLMRSVNGRLLFLRPIDGGAELWASDGTDVGTARIVDLPCLPLSSISLGDRLVFVLGGEFCPPVGSAGDLQLWSSDGTLTGTSPVGIIPDQRNGFTGLCTVRERAVYLAEGLSGGVTLWTTDGTDGGSPLLRDGGAAVLGSAGDLVLLSIEPANPTRRSVTWVSDGTSTGTVRVPSVAAAWWQGRIGSALIGSGWDGRHGHELWKVLLPERLGVEGAPTVECDYL